MIGGQIENRRHLALIGSRPHQIGATPPTQHKTQTIQKDRFARAGLAGQHVQARLEFNLKPVDDQHVTYG